LEDIVDDSAVNHALSDDDEAFSLDFADRFARIDSLTLPDLSPLDNLASGPFRWDAPQLAPRPGSLVFVQSPSLSEAEQRRLISLAMGQGPPVDPWGAGGGIDSLPAVGQATAMAPHPRPTPQQQGAKPASSASGPAQSDKALDENGKPKNPERAAHNDIERKYRTNLKDKIAELRDAVPALSIAGEGDPGGPAPKVSKVRMRNVPPRFLSRPGRGTRPERGEGPKGLTCGAGDGPDQGDRVHPPPRAAQPRHRAAAPGAIAARAGLRAAPDPVDARRLPWAAGSEAERRRLVMPRLRWAG